jgi:uncharacterized repeat protein (TIGR02543 family)
MHARIEPVIPEQYARWCGQPPSYWQSSVNYARNFTLLRRDIYRIQVMQHLQIDGTAELAIAADPPGSGTVQLTLIEVAPPFSGTLFTGIPITATAVPAAGYTFAGWTDGDLGDLEATTFTLDSDRSITATFE